MDSKPIRSHKNTSMQDCCIIEAMSGRIGKAVASDAEGGGLDSRQRLHRLVLCKFWSGDTVL